MIGGVFVKSIVHVNMNVQWIDESMFQVASNFLNSIGANSNAPRILFDGLEQIKYQIRSFSSS